MQETAIATPLRILILEDNAADAKLMQFELEEAGIDFTATVVSTQKDFIRELHAFSPDLILSDYDLPLYTGQTALSDSKRLCPDVPFILVTGAVTEDRAVDIMTSGAKDFVMKNRLHKLAVAVRRAVEEAGEHKARKKAEAEVRAASLYARNLLEASLDPMVTISASGKIMDANKATEQVTGVPRDRLIGTDFADYFTEPDKARAGYEKAFSHGSVKDYLLALRHVSGRITEVIYNASTYTDETGEVKGVFAAARDVTVLKKAEKKILQSHRDLDDQVKKRTAALETEIDKRKKVEKETERLLAAVTAEKERLAALMNSITDEIWFADTEKRFAIINPSALHEFRLAHDTGVDVETLAAGLEVYRPDGSIRPVEDAPPLRALRGEVVRNEEEIIRTPASGEFRFRQVSATPVRDADGAIIGAVSVVRDVTERKEAEEALKQQSAKLEAANKDLDSFAYSVSHDLRAPLRAIDGFSKMLLKKTGSRLNRDERELITVVRDNVQKMGQLLDGLLALARVGREAVSFTSIDMCGLVKEVWQNLQQIDANRTIRLSTEPLPPAYGDIRLIRQVMMNLLTNAVKFTQKKEVAKISIGGSATNAETVYYVSDNGAGFDMKCYGKLFGVFNRLHSETEYEGTGVGLAIVQRIINRHGGRVWAEGKEHAGAVFYFSLPNHA
jgi:PAS domain S-box-containing protein